MTRSLGRRGVRAKTVPKGGRIVSYRMLKYLASG
jgi:hypothetical protein